MPHFVRSALSVAVLSLLGMAPVIPVAAQSAADALVTVNVNMARVLRINAPAATVIIGNPGVADVTIQDPQTLVLTGKSYGRTNMIILDANGDPIADTVVEVAQLASDTVTVFMGSARTSIACAPNCQPVIMMGDDTSFTTEALTSSSVVQSMAGQ
ncbi:pilus assembly protein N-terminal domain-containing protein [Pelagibacterium lacus]|uniref:Pilus assembly protein n=1 Tax=Pelagibacterium lacus TaxID=2282655 RepID=A0A369W9R3_9HYPH|nr:pilus assembly protein N-terminal domain-containing protein [Pelagibacterium lacus]RDE10012.1 pilus assembly protein [Pelagibacterium lacus]